MDRSIRIKWLSVACFEIEKDGHTVVTDPFISENKYSPCSPDDIEHCDLMTLTHLHWDHIVDIPYLSEKFGFPPILTGSLSALPLCEWGNLKPSLVYPMDANLELDFEWVKVKALYGRHVTSDARTNELRSTLSRMPFVDKAMGDMQILGSLEYRNFLFTYPDGLKVLIWGNDLSPVQRAILAAEKPDIAIMQGGGQQLSDPDAFVSFVSAFRPKVIIPHHMALSSPYEKSFPRLNAAAEALKNALPDIAFLRPEFGEWLDIRA